MGEGLKRIASCLLADRAWCELNLGHADKARALADAKLDTIVALLKEHDPVRVRGELDVLRRDHDGLARTVADNHRSHHRLLRQLQRRLDLARIQDVDTDPGDEP